MRKLYSKWIALIFVVLFLTFNGCAGLLEGDKDAPHILSIVSSVTISKNTSLAVTLEYMEVFDLNGDALSLIVHAGENYTVEGPVILPLLEYVGDLKVPVQLLDSTGLYSAVDTLCVTVSEEDIIPILPLEHGALWDYSDSFFVVDSVSTSTLLCQKQLPFGKIDPSSNLFTLTWERGNIQSVSYLYENRPLGLYQVGAISAVDTLIIEREAMGPFIGNEKTGQYKFRYPALPTEEWEYFPIQVKETSGFLYQNSLPVKMKVISDNVFVTVPAGVYECMQYEYSYERAQSRKDISNEECGLFSQLGGQIRNTESTIRVVLYYSPGIGCVQSETHAGNRLVVKKVLRSYKLLGEL